MNNLFNLDAVKNNVHRSGFDLSNRNCFTAKIGEILPVWWSEVLPGDKFKVKIQQFMRTAPIQTASFGRVRQYYDFYFVPYKLLWDKFPAFASQTENPYHAASLTQGADTFERHPYFTNVDIFQYISYLLTNPKTDEGGSLASASTGKLLSYLGYKNLVQFDEEVALNPFPLLAYQKIYQDHFRYGQWEKASPWTYNLDWINKNSQSKLDVASLKPVTGDKTLFDMQYCNLDKDLVIGVMPSPQFGDAAIVGPITGTFSGNAILGSVPYLTANDDTRILASMSTTAGDQINTVLGALPKNGSGETNGAQISTGFRFNAMKESALGVTVALLRLSECTQKWKEITLSGSPDVREQIYKHWGVKMSPSDSYISQYLGGSASDIDISEVINNNITGENAADIAGKGISANSGYITFDNPNNDYGIIMCVYHAKPIVEYLQDYFTPRALTKTAPTDYAIPEFDSIGMQQVLNYETCRSDKPFDVWGFAPRYYEYKTALDRVNGAFADTLKPWIIPYFFTLDSDSGPVTYLNFKVPIRSLDNMFKVAADSTLATDHFYNTVYFDVKAVRSLSRSGLPF